MTTRARYLDWHRKYNMSVKGRARNLRYEARHPERKLRWETGAEPARNRRGTEPDPMPETLPPAPADEDPWTA